MESKSVMDQKMKEWDMSYKYPKIDSQESYKEAIAKLHEYFGKPESVRDLDEDSKDFSAKVWKTFTYLLKSVVKYERDVLGYKYNIR